MYNLEDCCDGEEEEAWSNTRVLGIGGGPWGKEGTDITSSLRPGGRRQCLKHGDSGELRAYGASGTPLGKEQLQVHVKVILLPGKLSASLAFHRPDESRGTAPPSLLGHYRRGCVHTGEMPGAGSRKPERGGVKVQRRPAKAWSMMQGDCQLPCK